MSTPRYLLLQVRNPDDSMRAHEVDCFVRSLACEPAALEVHDLLAGVPSQRKVEQFDAFLFGGSGDYSAAAIDDPWLDRTLHGLRQLFDTGKPIFASCWGFQAMARALGGKCITDPENAELGTIEISLTEHGRTDPLFSALPRRFAAQAGHMDHVVELPPAAIRLASSDLVANQAFTFAGHPVYCTQFHPELDRTGLITRLETYPAYCERIARVPFAEFIDRCCRETPDSNRLLARFAELVLRRSEGQPSRVQPL